MLLCQHWAAHTAQQHQGKPRKPCWGVSSSKEQQAGAADSSGQADDTSSTLGPSAGSNGADVFEAVDSSSLRQLWQVHMWLQDSAQGSDSTSSSRSDSLEDGGKGGDKDSSSSSREVYDSSSGLLAAFSAAQLAVCEAAWKSQVQQVTTPRWQEDLAATVGALPGVANVQLEQLTADGCFSIDIGAELVDMQALAVAAGQAQTLGPAGSPGGRVSSQGLVLAQQRPPAVKQQPAAVQDDVAVWRLAVEADGPSHFVLTGPGLDTLVLRGEAQLRSRALQARGYVVVRVSYLDWELRQQQHDVQEVGSDGSSGRSSHGSLRWLAAKVWEAVHAGG